MKFSFLVLAIAAVFSLSLTANAQQEKAVEVTPCPNEPASRPTLKRRRTNPDNQAAVDVPNFPVVAEPCNNAHTELKNVVRKPARVRFEGLTAIADTDLLISLRGRNINPMIDLASDGESLNRTEKAIKDLLAEYGHRKAEVSARLEAAESESRTVTFVISEGSRFTISEIRFAGNRVFSEHLLTAKMNEFLARFDKDRLNVYKSDRFEYCLYLLKNFERSQGYLQANFGEPQVAEVGEGLIITVPAVEGVLYRLGHLEIEGANHIAEQDIRAMLDMRTGDVANGEKVGKTFYEDLKALYGEKGFIQYTAEIVPEFLAGPRVGEGIVDLKIVIDEGRKFRIRKIFFKGDNLPENDLRGLLSLREGDVYNQKLFEEGVNRLNETGWFNWVDKDRDVDYRTNEEEGLLDLAITIARRTATD